MVKQFFRGSSIVVFFYTVISIFSAMAISLAVRINERNTEIAIYYGEIANTGNVGTDSSVDNTMSVVIFLAIALLLLVNIFSVTGYWIKVKQSEIRARIISGGSSAAVCLRLLLNYTMIIFISVVIGTALAAGVLTLDLLVIKLRHFINGFFQICELSLLFSAIGVVTGVISIYKSNNKLVRSD